LLLDGFDPDEKVKGLCSGGLVGDETSDSADFGTTWKTSRGTIWKTGHQTCFGISCELFLDVRYYLIAFFIQ
jgi:hypothetical protein|tara:strand:- start:135 stop:350 length:216 start_codon:yes stop_codon:yes gene_type:complete